MKLCLCILPAALICYSAVSPAATITGLTWNDSTNDNVSSTDTTGIKIQYASTLVSFDVGATTYSSFSTATSTTASGSSGVTPFWGINATNLTASDDQLAATDNRIDTGMVNIGDNSEFFFASPTGLDQVFFLFDVGSNDGSRTLEFIDGALGAVVGNSILVDFNTANIAQMDFERVNNTGTTSTSNAGFRGVALSFSDFGITDSGDLASIAGIRIDGGNILDPIMLGFAAIPEPSSALIGILGGLLLLRRRRVSHPGAGIGPHPAGLWRGNEAMERTAMALARHSFSDGAGSSGRVRRGPRGPAKKAPEWLPRSGSH